MGSIKALRTMIGLIIISLLFAGRHITQDFAAQTLTPIVRIMPGSIHTSIHPLGDKELIQNISVVLEAKQSEYNGTEPMTILFTLANKSDRTVSISRWDIPLDGLYNDTFRVLKDGQPIQYIGPLTMEIETGQEDYLTLRPGKVISTTFDLALNYELIVPGEYNVQFESYFLLMNIKNPGKLIESQDFIIKGINSNEIPIRLQETRLPKPSFVKPITNHCSRQQQAIITSDLQKATQLACNAYQALNTRPTDKRFEAERYLTWFGEYVKDHYKNVTQKFKKMCDIFSTQPITFECGADCDPVLTSWTTFDAEYEINLCHGFWELESSGTDSRPGVIVHEMSHFRVIADTDDVVYGKPSCKDLATNSPEQAIKNADSYEYFAENDPSLESDKP